MKSLLFKILAYTQKKRWTSNKRPRVIIQTSKFFHKDLWKKALKADFLGYGKSEIIYVKSKFALVSVINDADCCFLWSLSKYISIETSNLKMIYFGSRGLEFLNERYIPASIKIENPKLISSEAIAEYTLSMALMLNRKLHIAVRNQSRKKWHQKSLVNENYIPLKQKTIGILGLGNNGTKIAQYFKNFGCKIVALDKRQIIDNNVEEFFFPNQLTKFLSLTDILILAAPLVSDTKHIINSKSLAYLKKDSIIINTSRGEIIAEKDLIKAIKQKIVKYAVLDVFKNEPLKFFDSKWKNPAIIITPHIAGNINISLLKFNGIFVINLIKCSRVMFEFIISNNNEQSLPEFKFKDDNLHTESKFKFNNLDIKTLSFKNEKDHAESKDAIILIYGSIYHPINAGKKGQIHAGDLLNKLELLKNPGLNFRGNYAIIYYYKQKRELLIINDPLGLKPIYYGTINNNIYISSSLSLLKNITSEINESALLEKLIFNYNINNSTIFKNIYSLENGSSLSLGGDKVHIENYFSIKDYALNNESGRFKLETLLDRFNTIVSNRVDKYDKTLIALTAGNDGRAVLSSAYKLGVNYDTYSFGMQNGENTLIPEQIARQLDFKHHSIYLSEGYKSDYANNAVNTIDLSDANLHFGQQTTLFCFLNLPIKKFHNRVLSGLLAGEILGPIHLKDDYFNKIYFDLIYQQKPYDLALLKQLPYIGELINQDFIKKNYEEVAYSIEKRKEYISSIKSSAKPHLYYYVDLIERGFRRFYGSQMHLSRYHAENIPVFYDLDILDFIFNTNYHMIFKSSFKSLLHRWQSRKPQSYITYSNYHEIAKLPLDRGFSPADLIHPFKKYMTFVKYYKRKFITKKNHPDFDSRNWCKNLLNDKFSKELKASPYFNISGMREYISNVHSSNSNYSVNMNRIISDYIFLYL